jgi:energy-coupling factor transporter ATP-binding protein EcfA2
MTEGQKVTAAAARDPGAGAGAGPIADAHPAPAAEESRPGHKPKHSQISAGSQAAQPGEEPAQVAEPHRSQQAKEPSGSDKPAQAPEAPQAKRPAQGQPAQGQEPPHGPGSPQAPGSLQAPGNPAGQKSPQGPEPAQSPQIEPHVRVDGRLLESAILALRKPIVAASLPLEAPGVEEARQERHKLLSQIDDYLLPRLRESGAPILVALVGSTGAGKSTLVNSIVGTHVSMTGIRRPTTNSPVLACNPDDVGWFAENVFLPTVPRVRQEGLARSGKDGLLVLAANEGMPKGVALLDTPDIDSVVQAHREFAYQFLDASDLWLFMTTASRYADAMVWELLQHARDRGAALGIVLSRVLPAVSPEVVEHFQAMLEANGLGGNQRFVIPETVLIDAKLPPEVCAPVREWLAETAEQPDRRVAVLTRTMSGVLDTFRTRVPSLAAQVEDQVTLRAGLTNAVTGSYQAGMDEIDRRLQDGSLMSGEVLARWQDFAGAGDVLQSLQTRRGSRQRRHRAPAKAQALKMAARTAVESLITSAADRAAEDCLARWRDHPAGAALLDQLGSGGGAAAWQSEFAAEAGLIFGWEPEESGAAASEGPGDPQARIAALGRSSPDLATHAARAVSAWQDQVTRLVQAENVTKRSIAKAVSLDNDSLATVLIVSLFGAGEDDTGTAAIPRRLLTTLFGAGPLRDFVARTGADLRHRITLLLDEEMRRFADVIDAVGTPDAAASLHLYQATYALEVAR